MANFISYKLSERQPSAGWLCDCGVLGMFGNQSCMVCPDNNQGGITIGRFFLSPLGHRYGEKLCVYVLGVTAAAFQVLVWLIPNVIGNAIAVSIVGLLLGPVYPCAQTIFTRLLPRRTQTTAVGFISSAGSSGGAVAPFTTGLLAQAAGTFVLHPICIGLFGIMLLSWSGLPRVHKRRD